MNHFNVATASEWVLLAGGIITFFGGLLAGLKKIYKVARLLESVHKNDVKRAEESKVLMAAAMASLDGLKQLGANGPVSEAWVDIKDYLVKQCGEIKT